ncbi:hypothetical protein MUG91_G20n66 [Manis pentadactyla]|nr:hypothetical protein MUG91_G20n66 [Manis pentadactyla]
MDGKISCHPCHESPARPRRIASAARARGGPAVVDAHFLLLPRPGPGAQLMTLNDVAGDLREEWVTWTLLRESSSGIPPSTVSRMGSQRDFQTKCNLRLGQEEEPWVLPLHSLEARKVLRADHTDFENQVAKLNQAISKAAGQCASGPPFPANDPGFQVSYFNILKEK